MDKQGAKKTGSQKQEVQVLETYLPSTPIKFLEIYNPIRLRRDLAEVKTVEQALQVKTPHIGEMVRKYGAEKVEAYIKVWLINLNETINLKRPLKEHQIDECAYLIVDAYRNITIADINLIFKKAKLGEYGELYESLSVDKILRWFNEYFDTRCETAGAISRRKAEELKGRDNRSQRSYENLQKEQDYNKAKIDYLTKGILKGRQEE